MRNALPYISGYLLSFMMENNVRDSAMVDYEDEFLYLRDNNGTFTAIIWLWKQILFSLPSFIHSEIYWSIVMFKNYLKIALRNIMRQKGYSFINISGLAIGLACCFLIVLFVRDELSYDTFNINGANIYRAVSANGLDNMNPRYAGSPAPLAAALKEKFPEIINTVRFDDFAFKEKALVTYNNKKYYENHFVLADPSFFDIFSYELIRGNPETALTNPNNLVMTESAARKYFGDEDPIGKLVMYEGEQEFVVNGIMKDMPHNSHMKFDMVGSFENIDQYNGANYMNNWGTWNFYTYIQLDENVDPIAFQAKAKSFFFDRDGEESNLVFQPLLDIHLRSSISKEWEPNGDINNVYILSALALIILLIACINFMNLYTANSVLRAKEVGLRKVVGAQRSQLISQFLGESTLISIISMVVCLVLVELALPEFNKIIERSISTYYFNNVPILVGLVVVTFCAWNVDWQLSSFLYFLI